MKTIIRIFALGVLALGAALPASRAVDQQPPAVEHTPSRLQQRREARLKQLDEKLHLTPEQKAKIEAIWKEAAGEARELREAERQAAREQRKQRREALRESHDQVRAVLTPEQQKIFDALPRPTWHGPSGKKEQPVG